MKLSFEDTDGIGRVSHCVSSYVVNTSPDPHRPGSRGYVNLLVETTVRIAGIVSTARSYHWQFHVGADALRLDGIIEVETYFIEASGRFDRVRGELELVAATAWDERHLRTSWSETDRNAASFGVSRRPPPPPPPPPPATPGPRSERSQGEGASQEARRTAQARDAAASAQWWSEFNDQFFGGPGAYADFVDEYERFGGASRRRAPSGAATPPAVAPAVASALRELGLPADRLPAQEELKAAWSAAARKTHPDAGGSSDAFVKVKAAYDEVTRAISGPRGRG